MTTYKEFTNQYGEKTREITINETYFALIMSDDKEEQEELNDDFYFRYGKSEDSEKAFNILTK